MARTLRFVRRGGADSASEGPAEADAVLRCASPEPRAVDSDARPLFEDELRQEPAAASEFAASAAWSAPASEQGAVDEAADGDHEAVPEEPAAASASSAASGAPAPHDGQSDGDLLGDFKFEATLPDSLTNQARPTV